MNTPDSKTNQKRRLVVILLILAGLLLVGLFAARTFRTVMRIRRMERVPLSTDVDLIRPWMTIPYISGAYRVPPEVLAEACHLPPPKKHESLAQINRAIDPDNPDSLLECVKEAVSDFQQSHPTPPAEPN